MLKILDLRDAVIEKGEWTSTEFRFIKGRLKAKEHVKLPYNIREDAYYFDKFFFRGHYYAFRGNQIYLMEFGWMDGREKRHQFYEYLRHGMSPVDAFTFLEL
jgi:hypothetical protein